jgi:uncharacterized RDD family membrane protein YckC
MKTWRMRIVTKTGGPLTPWRAMLRYLLSWLWFVPGLAAAKLLETQGWMLIVFPALNFAVWTATALFDRDRQFLHDRLAGTRMVAA